MRVRPLSVAPSGLLRLTQDSDDLVEAEAIGFGRSVGYRSRHVFTELTGF